MELPTQFPRWIFPGFDQTLGSHPLIMGIVNVTPDSFSDGGKFVSVNAAVDHAQQLVHDGADLLDVGGESTRPGAQPVALKEELQRVIPVIERLSQLTDIPISIDTYKSEVARQALKAGARIVNDISGLRFDCQMIDVCLESSCGIICMHIQGTPLTMQNNPQYSDVVNEICDELSSRLDLFERTGIPRERVVIDPGIGFGKTADHNLEILSNIRQIRRLGRPVLIGHSRKRFLQRILGRSVDEKSTATIGVSIALAQQSVDILRVHEVGANRSALLAWRATIAKDEVFR